MSGSKRDRDDAVEAVDLNSEAHLTRVFDYLKANDKTSVTLLEGQIQQDMLIRKGRWEPRIIRGFMRHSQMHSKHNLVFQFKGQLPGDAEAQTHRFNLTLSRQHPRLLPKIQGLDLRYSGSQIDKLTNGKNGKPFNLYRFHDCNDDEKPRAIKPQKRQATEESSVEQQSVPPATSSVVAPLSIAPVNVQIERPLPVFQLPTVPVHLSAAEIQKEAELMARDLFLREDADVRQKAVASLLKDPTIRAEARQQVFEFFKTEGGIRTTLEQAYAAKFEADRLQEQQAHQDLLIRLETDKQQFLEEHRRTIQESQAKVLAITADMILTDATYRKYRESAINIATARLEKDPEVIAVAEKMVRRAIMLERRDGLNRIDGQRIPSVNGITITPEDHAAAQAFASLN